jgi:hypothetical protein
VPVPGTITRGTNNSGILGTQPVANFSQLRRLFGGLNASLPTGLTPQTGVQRIETPGLSIPPGPTVPNKGAPPPGPARILPSTGNPPPAAVPPNPGSAAPGPGSSGTAPPGSPRSG